MSNPSNTRLMASNTLWNALERFSTMGIQLLCTFVLAHFLTPEHFGLVGMLVVFTLVGNTLTESGFSQTLIRESSCSRLTLSTVFWANLVLSLLVYGVLYAAAPFIAQWFGYPELIDVSRVTFLVIPLGSLCIIHTTICYRELRFRTMCLVAVVASVVSCGVAIAVAWHTRSVWALVVQNVLAYALRTAGYWVVLRWLPSFAFSWRELSRLFTFSRHLLVTGLIGNVFNNIYTLLIGRYYGAAQAGYFAQADRIRQVSSASATQVVQSVSYPILSRLQDADPRLRSAYSRIIQVTLLLVGTGMAMLMTVSHDLMPLLMGSDRWIISGRYLYALGVAGILFPLHAVNQNILLVKGLGRTVLWLEVARRTLMVALLALSVHFSVKAFVWSYAVYSFLLIFLNLYVCGRPIGYGLMAQLADIWPILSRLIVLLVVAQMVCHFLAPIGLLPRIVITLIVDILLSLAIFYRLPAFTLALHALRR